MHFIKHMSLRSFFSALIRSQARRSLCLLFLSTTFLIFLINTKAQQGPPPAPALTATAGHAKVTVSWGAVSGATGYSVYKSSTGAPVPQGYLNVFWGGEATSFVDTQVNNGETYYYIVKAFNSAGQGPDSNVASATVSLEAPSVTATAGSAKVTVSWGAVPGALGYSAYRSATGAPVPQGYLNVFWAGEATSFVDTQVNNGQTYYYIIIASNGAGQGHASNVATATVNLAAPSVVATAGEEKIAISWNAVEGASGYRIYRAANQVPVPQDYLNIWKTTSDTSVEDTQPDNGVTYYYIVTAGNQAGYSPYSNVASAKVCRCNCPGIPLISPRSGGQ